MYDDIRPLCYIPLHFVCTFVTFVCNVAPFRKKEIRNERYMVLVISILTTFHNVSFLIRDMMHYWPLIWRCYLLGLRISLFLMLNMNTRRVVIKYGFLMRQKSENNSRDPRAIRLTSRQMRHFAHDTTFYLVQEDQDESTFSLTNDEQTELLSMKKTLLNYKTFESFMHYILDVKLIIYDNVLCANLHHFFPPMF